MKKLLIIAVLAFSFGANAQQVEPKFEKEGNKVKATYFHANGEVSQQGYFLNEKLEGEWKMFNDKGQKIAMGNYENGVKTGKWLFWEGDVKKEVNFDNNKIASVTNAKSKESMVSNE
ncbi:toxin-antitoxin system YwqK family antitoxin [Maribacter sp. X9]|uniref:toxin-antitoxin system YwqK family antitoxin n=1 Tax=Maribacter sp. X9 TaxID=3402159 RepID=UPI003AF34E27